MRVYIITQEDVFAIPRNIQLLAESNRIIVSGIATVHTANSLSNKKTLLLNSFSLKSIFNFARKLYWIKLLNSLDYMSGSGLLFNKKSISSISKKYKIPLERVSDVNNAKFVAHLKDLNLDLIVSYSAPSIFRSEVLNTPKYGCINLHCSYLPHYSGILPSFWVLYHKEKITGVTIHYMDSKIDNGKIIAQEKVEIDDLMSWLDLIIKTKQIGGDLMLKVLLDFDYYKERVKENAVEKESYFSWPTKKQFKELGKRRRLA